MAACTTVNLSDLEFEVINIVDKDVWVSKFRSWTADFQMLLVKKPFLLKRRNGMTLKTFPNRTNLWSVHRIPFPKLIGTWKVCIWSSVDLWIYKLVPAGFSIMNYIKSEYRLRLTDESSRSCDDWKSFLFWNYTVLCQTLNSSSCVSFSSWQLTCLHHVRK